MADDVIDTIVGEAKAGSYDDMMHIASVITNRARALGVSVADVVRNKREFNAYGKALPAGTAKFRSLAQKALREVMTKGPVTNAQFYATPAASKNLPAGLTKVGATAGHQYYVDPKNRAINTAVGFRQPKSFQAPLSGPASASAAANIDLGMKAKGPGLMALAPNGLRMANVGVRSMAVNPDLLDKIKTGVQNVYGKGYTAEVYSGGQPAKGTSTARVGTVRHDLGRAADTYVLDPQGKRLKGDALAPIAQYWAANKIGGVGLEMPGGGIHLDNWETPPESGKKKGAMTWSYGALTPGQRAAFDAGLAGQMPDNMAALKNTPVPTPRNGMAMMAQAKEADRIAGPQFAARSFKPGGIINSPAVSLNPVSSATASERMAPKDLSRSYLASIQSRTRQAPQTSAPAQAKTSTGISFSRATPAMQSMRQTAQMSVPDTAQMSMRASPYSAPQAMMRDRAMPSGPISSPASPVTSPASMMAGYQQYGQTRAAAPVNAPSYSPMSVTAQAGTMTTPAQEIAGPVTSTIQAPVSTPAPSVAPAQKETFKDKIGKAFTPQNIQKAGLTAVGTALGGPVGGLLAGFLGNAMIGNKNPQAQGLLSGLFSGQGPMQSTYIGSGINAVTSAMGSDRRGDTARYNSQGGGFITNLGGGSYQRTSDKHGWTETTDNSGHTGISYGGKKR